MKPKREREQTCKVPPSPAIALACVVHCVHDVDAGAAAPERALAFAEPLLTWPPAFLDKVKNYLSVALGASRGGRTQDLSNRVPGTKQRAAHLKDVTFNRRIP